MTDLDHLKDDLAFVRAAVDRGRDDRGTAPSYFLWAATGLVVALALVAGGVAALRAPAPAAD